MNFHTPHDSMILRCPPCDHMFHWSLTLQLVARLSALIHELHHNSQTSWKIWIFMYVCICIRCRVSFILIRKWWYILKPLPLTSLGMNDASTFLTTPRVTNPNPKRETCEMCQLCTAHYVCVCHRLTERRIPQARVGSTRNSPHTTSFPHTY